MCVESHRNWGIFVTALCLVFSAAISAQETADSGHPDTYSAEPVEGWVVDAETNEPLEGVVVFAAWILDGWTTPFVKWGRLGTLELMESVTDENGRYSFPEWGPLKRPQGAVLWAQSPELLFFKSRYDIEILSNPLTAEAPTKSLRTSHWNGKTIKLKRFEGTMRRYSRRIRAFAGSTIINALESCSWKKIPNTVIALRRENEHLEPYGVRGVTVERMLPLPGKGDPCGALEFWERTTIQ